MSSPDAVLAQRLWRALDGEDRALDALRFVGPAGGLPSRFHVSDLACATIGVATLAAADLWARRRGGSLRQVTVDRRLAAAAFRCERLLQPIGWNLPDIWDPIAGDYETADGWIRLHTNYSYHRGAVLRVLNVPADRQRVAAAVRSLYASELERDLVVAGGCAAALRTLDAWRAHPQGAALATEPLCDRTPDWVAVRLPGDTSAPLAGVRVLDMTRVIAGPIATRHLAAFGAEVLRIDPPGFKEVPALLPESTRGKRCASLDLSVPSDRAIWEPLVTRAHVLVHGYRPGAMEQLGYTDARLRELNPSLIIVCHDAYGWTGPWLSRRGFDSLVQMSSGIAHPGNAGQPTPLPAQALDHATGYLAAAAVCRALADGSATARLSLARTALLLIELGTDGDAESPALQAVSELLELTDTEWGPVRQVPHPANMDGYMVRWPERAGMLGRHRPEWSRAA